MGRKYNNPGGNYLNDNRSMHWQTYELAQKHSELGHNSPIVTMNLKGITKFWYGVMNLVQINILEAYAFLQY